MKKIITNYENLEAEREKLQIILEKTKDKPLEKLKNFSATSLLYDNIDELKNKILLEGRKKFEKESSDESSVFLERFKEIDDFAETIKSPTALMTATKNTHLAIDHLKDLTKLQEKKNQLMEDIVFYAKEKSQKKKKKNSM